MARLVTLALALVFVACDDDVEEVGDDDTSMPDTPCLDVGDAPPLDTTVCASEASCRFAQQETSYYQGFCIAADGDFDGDGVMDLAVGAPGADVAQDEGQVGLYNLASLAELVPAPVAVVVGAAPLEQAGFSAGFAGDIDGDGLDDLLLGARGNGDGGNGAGAVYLVRGRELGNDVTTPDALGIDGTFTGARALGRVGTSVSGILDATGDGLAEIAMGFDLYQDSNGLEYQDHGGVAVFHGAADGLSGSRSVLDADKLLEAPEVISQVGYALAGKGDITGDGLGDLLVGAPYAESSAGKLYVVSGTELAVTGAVAIADVAVVLTGEGGNERFGAAISYLGDVNGDSVDDVAVGAPGSDLTWPDGGAVTVLAGSPDVGDETPPEVLAVIGSEWDDFQFGFAVAPSNDLDGDGLNDLVVGARDGLMGPIMKGGRVYVFYGRSEGWGALEDATEADADVVGMGVGDSLSYALAAGDVDGDGTDDLLMSAPYRDRSNTDSGEIYLFWGPTR